MGDPVRFDAGVADVPRRADAGVAAPRVVLNLLPGFDFAHVRLPGILQRIGLCYAIVGTYCVCIARRDGLPVPALVAAGAALLLGYAGLLLAGLLARAIPEARVASAAYSALLLLVLGAGLWQLYRRRIVIWI